MIFNLLYLSNKLNILHFSFEVISFELENVHTINLDTLFYLLSQFFD